MIFGVPPGAPRIPTLTLPARDQYGRCASAEVAELADAQASGACGGNPVGVQISPSAPRRFDPGYASPKNLPIDFLQPEEPVHEVGRSSTPPTRATSWTAASSPSRAAV